MFVLHDGQDRTAATGSSGSPASYTFDGRGRWKGELITEPYALAADPWRRVREPDRSVSAFPAPTPTTAAETFNTGFVGKRSIAFHTTMRFLAEE